MPQVNLLLSLPQSFVTATSLGIDGFAWHRSPGSASHYRRRSILADLALDADGQPAFQFLDEGSWRDVTADTRAALEAVRRGKRTKTAISNNAFNCTPISAYRRVYLVKTGGETLELRRDEARTAFRESACHEGMAPEEIAAAIGQPAQRARPPRAYMVLSPIEFIVLSSLTPEEYVWYATHRPGKIFRQVVFTEVTDDEALLAAESVYEEAARELSTQAHKKTKTIAVGGCFNRVPFQSWRPQEPDGPSALYVGDATGMSAWRFPAELPRTWERAGG
jgi:hypothetical protein